MKLESCLIIDDDPEWRLLLAQHLARLAPKVFVHSVDNLDDGFAAMRETSWSVVLLDLGLPGYKLYPPEALTRMMEQYPQQATVVVSGSGDVDDTGVHLDLLRLGPVDAVSKAEVSAGVLDAAIRHALQRAARATGQGYPAVATIEQALREYTEGE